jgi:glutaredoxin 3
MAMIEIYTKAECPYCDLAKRFLEERGESAVEYRVDLDPSRLSEMLARSGGRRTVPQIFIHGEHVGGYDDLVAAHRSGRLATLLGEGDERRS